MSLPRPDAAGCARNVTILAIRGRNRMVGWRSDASKTMLAPVKIRLIRPLIYVLVAAQLLLSAPVVNAFAAAEPDGTMSAACAGEMPTLDDGGKCPCCPDGVSMNACLATCTAAAAVMPTVHVTTASVVASVIADAPVTALVSLSDPPLKPPPIV
jgi:hypothetical protein